MNTIFGAESTADEVLEGLDLHGKRVLLTGASAGIGLETARALVAHGATVVGTSRNPENSLAATQKIEDTAANGGGFTMEKLDLASLFSVRDCADTLNRAKDGFDVVLGNAGLMAGPKSLTEDGIEAQFGTNFLGHYLLINCIVGLIRPAGRIVLVSSAGHRRSDVDLQDPNFTHTSYNEYLAYGRSKTATILLAVELDRRLREQGICATAIHPGAIQTETVKNIIDSLGEGKDAAIASFHWKTASQGAATTIWAGFVAPGSEVTGKYCEDCHVAEVEDDPKIQKGVRSYALNAETAGALWALGERMVGERFPLLAV